VNAEKEDGMFFKELAERFGKDVFSEYAAAAFGNGALAVEGVKSVSSFSDSEIRLNVKGGALVISGSELKIVEIGGGGAYITGKLSGIEFL
jgi:sporulation protein YqfC